MLHIAADAPERKVIRILNPISSHLTIMRPLLAPSLLNVVVDNLRKGNAEGRLFEMSNIYIPKQLPVTELPDERLHLGFAAWGSEEDFFAVKGAVESFGAAFGLSLIHIYIAGQEARAEMERVTQSIAQHLGVQPAEIIYTSGASEANNLALKGIAHASRHIGKHIISTQLEHSSVGASLSALQQQGYEIDLLDIGRDGRVDLDQLRELMRDDTILVAVCAVDSLSLIHIYGRCLIKAMLPQDGQ